jgi:hypothetical protein
MHDPLNRWFNQAKQSAESVNEYLRPLFMEPNQLIDRNELSDLVTDAHTLASRIDRLHHDYTNAKLDQVIRTEP